MNDLFIEKFNGCEIHNFIWNSKPCWMATEIGELLEYAEPSKGIVACIDRERFRIGKEYDILKGAELKLFKEVANQTLGNSFKFAPRVIIFYEPGLYGFLAYTEKPLGVSFRTWIREEVVPQIRATGAYVLDDDYYNKTYNSDIEFTCDNHVDVAKDMSMDIDVDRSVGSKVILNDDNLNVVQGDFDVDKFQRLRLATESAKLLKGLLDDVDTDSICKLAVVKALFSESGIELPIYFNKK